MAREIAITINGIFHNRIFAGRKFRFFHFPIDKVLNQHYNIINKEKDRRKDEEIQLIQNHEKSMEMKRSWNCRSLTFGECLKRHGQRQKLNTRTALLLISLGTEWESLWMVTPEL